MHDNRFSKSFVNDQDKLCYLTDSLNELDARLETYNLLLHQMYHQNNLYNDDLEREIDNTIQRQHWDKDIIPSNQKNTQTDFVGKLLEQGIQTDDIIESFFDR